MLQIATSRPPLYNHSSKNNVFNLLARRGYCKRRISEAAKHAPLIREAVLHPKIKCRRSVFAWALILSELAPMRVSSCLEKTECNVRSLVGKWVLYIYTRTVLYQHTQRLQVRLITSKAGRLNGRPSNESALQPRFTYMLVAGDCAA